jgi:hypothetical protein
MDVAAKPDDVSESQALQEFEQIDVAEAAVGYPLARSAHTVAVAAHHRGRAPRLPARTSTEVGLDV